MQKTLGDEIVALLGVSESDDRMLDVFDKLGVDKNEFERDEDDGAFWIELENEMGLELEFSDAVPKELKDPQYIGGQYLVDISFYENNTFLPYGLKMGDSLKTIEEKIGRKANYVATEDDCILTWLYEDMPEIDIDFKNNAYDGMEGMGFMLYEEPTKESEEYILPFKR
jgi:hypothetical protein